MKYVIDSKRKHSLLNYVRECCEFSNVLFALSHRLVKIKYANTLIGVVWAIIQPLIYIVLLVTVFNKLAGIENSSYSPLAYASVGLIAWMYFSTTISNATNNAISAQEIMSKVYFPRIFVPLSVAGEALIDLVVILIISVLCNAWVLGLHNIYVLPALLLLICFTVSMSIWITMWTIRFPDVRFIIAVMLRVLIFITPIAYGASLFSGSYAFLTYLNPLVGIIELLRYGIMDIHPNGTIVIYSTAITVLLFFLSLLAFIRFDRKIGDII